MCYIIIDNNKYFTRVIVSPQCECVCVCRLACVSVWGGVCDRVCIYGIMWTV